jgi:hypothetical protein
MNIQILRNRELSATAQSVLDAMTLRAPSSVKCVVKSVYDNSADALVLWGAGGVQQRAAIQDYRRQGKSVVMFDMGYLQDLRRPRFRFSLNEPHPQNWLSDTPEDKDYEVRWGARLTQGAGSYVLLVDMGPKSKVQYGIHDWAQRKLLELCKEFPVTSIIHRPKPRREYTLLKGVATDSSTPMPRLLQSAKLVVTHHSNAAVEAAIAGVPSRSEDGAAVWLEKREFTEENRMSFLRRLSNWQMTIDEAPRTWSFLLERMA